ncbi:hypothetical protein [Streptomyces sp. A0958]|uniref:hypothetical protein n=1 Tax=Streptomyces sp. A0958 TaxID=2563101 RepID=UPI00109E4FBD|nr:hypothetical protein [Streptomyces sp. A0958]
MVGAKPFELAVRFALGTAQEREFFVGVAEHADTGPVSLWIYPDKDDVARAAAALQKQDMPLFGSLGIGVESEGTAAPCTALSEGPAPPSDSSQGWMAGR